MVASGASLRTFESVRAMENLFFGIGRYWECRNRGRDKAPPVPSEEVGTFLIPDSHNEGVREIKTAGIELDGF